MTWKGRASVGVKLPLVVAAQAWAGVLWRVALAGLLGVGTWQAYNLRHVPDWAQRQLTREADAMRSVIGDTRKELLGEVASIRKDVMVRTDKALSIVDTTAKDVAQKADTRLADISAKVDAQLTATNSTVAGLRTDLQPVLKDVHSVTSAASEQADLLGRCEQDGIGNPDCLANRLIPAMKNFEHMAAAGESVFKAVEVEAKPTAKAVREGAQQVSGIAKDVHTFTSAAVAPVPWYKKLGNILYGGLSLFARLK